MRDTRSLYPPRRFPRNYGCVLPNTNRPIKRHLNQICTLGDDSQSEIISNTLQQDSSIHNAAPEIFQSETQIDGGMDTDMNQSELSMITSTESSTEFHTPPTKRPVRESARRTIEN